MSVILYSRESWGVCKCGHYDWMYDNSTPDTDRPIEFWGRAEGHGVCGAQIDTIDENGEESGMRCPCKQYTWVETIPHQRNYFGSPPKEPPAQTVRKET